MNPALVEYLGTLLFIGTISFSGNPALILAALGAAIGFGGKISGGHFNPAITTWAYFDGKVSAQKALYYYAAQILAALTVVFLGRR
jgi:aquaporin Z